jgi:hypothetical protein
MRAAASCPPIVLRRMRSHRERRRLVLKNKVSHEVHPHAEGAGRTKILDLTLKGRLQLMSLAQRTSLTSSLDQIFQIARHARR